MALLSPIQQFEQICGGALSVDNAVRGRATIAFQECKKQPEMFIGSLMQLLSSPSTKPDIRLFCAVMLRASLKINKENDKLKIWPKLNKKMQDMVKRALLDLIVKESGPVQRKTGDVIAMLANEVTRDRDNPSEKQAAGDWPELMPSLFTSVKSPSASLRTVVLDIICSMAEFTGPMKLLRPHLPTIKALLIACLKDQSSDDVRVSALKASNSVLLSLEDEERKSMAALIPLIFESLGQSCSKGDDSVIRENLEVLIDFVGALPHFFRDAVAPIVGLMSQIAESNKMEPDTRRMAMVFLLTFVEQGKGMVRKFKPFAPKAIQLGFFFLKHGPELDSIEEWTGSKDEDFQEWEDFAMGYQAVDRLAIALGGKSFMSIAVPVVRQWVQSQDWKERQAAMVCLGEMAEGCAQVLEKQLPQLLSIVCSSVARDPHPRVVWAGLNTIAQWASDLAPKFQTLYHKQIMPLLLEKATLRQGGNARVVRHALLCIVDFLAGISQEELAPFSDAMMQLVTTHLNSNDMRLQEAAVAVVAAMAASGEEDFSKYYQGVMPALLSIITNAKQKELRSLRGRAIEAAGLAGKAVGRELFAQHASQLMQLLVADIQKKLDGDDDSFRPIVQCLARICECVGQAFVPHLQYVIPPLLATAGTKDSAFLLDEDVDHPALHDDAYSKQALPFRGAGVKNLVINTSLLEDQAVACDMLYEYVKNLQEHFYPWVEPVAKVLVPLSRFRFNERVRTAAMQALPELIQCTSKHCKKNNLPISNVQGLWMFMFDPFIECVKIELGLDSLSGVLSALSDAIDYLGFAPPGQQVAVMTDLLETLMRESAMRRAERKQRSQHRDFDEEEAEILELENEREDEHLSWLSSVIKSLAKACGQDFFPMFHKDLHPHFTKLLAGGNGEITAALCTYCDVIEFCGEPAKQYIKAFFPFCIKHCTSDDVDVRQSSLYGIGVCCVKGGAAMAPMLPKVIPGLLAVMAKPDGRTGDNEPATDNAASSLGRICIAFPNAVDCSKLLPTWLNYLPMKGDEPEARVVYSHLCDFIDQNNPHIMGQGNRNLVKIVQIMSEALDTDAVDEEVTTRFQTHLKKWNSIIPAQAKQQLWATLQPKQQKKLVKHGFSAQ